jgi:hypothetical protein
MSALEREIQSASSWLQREAERIPFGSVGITIVLHRGAVSKVERSSSTTLKPETGDANGHAS